MHVQVGQCGNQIGSAFWRTLCKEHGISEVWPCSAASTATKEALHICWLQPQKAALKLLLPAEQAGQYEGTSSLQQERLSVYFSEASNGRYVPRCVLLDLVRSFHELAASSLG